MITNSQVETNINVRWETGMPHHPKSIELMNALAKIDFEHCDDYFCWKTGGDGDNGEFLMYQMDIFFERQDEEREAWKLLRNAD